MASDTGALSGYTVVDQKRAHFVTLKLRPLTDGPCLGISYVGIYLDLQKSRPNDLCDSSVQKTLRKFFFVTVFE